MPTAPDNFPAAPFSYLGDCGKPPGRYCLRADPVHLKADSRGLILFDASTFSLGKEEQEALVESLDPFLAEDGWRLQAGDAKRWYLLGNADGEWRAAPLSTVRGKKISEYLPTGKAAAIWSNRGNEIQMLLHAHPVNQQRAVRRQPAINSLWIWGGGQLPPAPAAPSFDRIYADDVLVQGLATWSGSASAAVPKCARHMLDEAARSGRILVVLDGCAEAAAYGNFTAWNHAIENYEQKWFSPLLDALSRRRIHAIELFPLNGYRYRLRGGDLLRFWRRPQPLQTLMAACQSIHPG